MSKAISKSRSSKGPANPSAVQQFIRRLRDGRYGVIRTTATGTEIVSVHPTEREAEIAARP